MSETLTRFDDFRPSMPPALAGGLMALNPELLQQPSERYVAYRTSPTALTIEPNASKLSELRQAFKEVFELLKAMIADNEIAPPNEQTWTYAAHELASMATLSIPVPLILPLQNGGIGFEWHKGGLNIELRFRKPYQVYVVLEDAYGVIPTLQDYDTNLESARKALRELASRK